MLHVISLSSGIRYQCMGTWYAKVDDIGYTYAAIAHTVQKDNREKYKCLVRLCFKFIIDTTCTLD